MLINGSNILDIKSLRGIDGDTDHYLVRAMIRIRISTHKYNNMRPSIRWNMEGLQNEAKQQQYREKLEQSLNSETEINEIEKLWEITAEAITKTAETVLGKAKEKGQKHGLMKNVETNLKREKQ